MVPVFSPDAEAPRWKDDDEDDDDDDDDDGGGGGGGDGDEAIDGTGCETRQHVRLSVR